jgi:hypothetical protein
MVIDKLTPSEPSEFNFQENFIEGDETIPNRAGARREPLRCPRCNSEHRPGELFCDSCGLVLSAADKTRQIATQVVALPSRRVGEAFIQDRKTIIFDVKDQAWALPVAQRITVGRLGTAPTDPTVEVDLTPFDALAKGVSRQHLLIERERDLIYVIDQNSLNGTFLNGHRLIAQQKRVLRSGDELQLGYLTIKVRFES